MNQLLVLDSGLVALKEQPMSALEAKIFWHLAKSLPEGGGIVVAYHLSKVLDFSYVRVTLGIKNLCDKGFLIRFGKEANSYVYRLNPDYFQRI